MKTLTILIALASLTGCQTVKTPDGPRTVYVGPSIGLGISKDGVAASFTLYGDPTVGAPKVESK